MYKAAKILAGQKERKGNMKVDIALLDQVVAITFTKKPDAVGGGLCAKWWCGGRWWSVF